MTALGTDSQPARNTMARMSRTPYESATESWFSPTNSMAATSRTPSYERPVGLPWVSPTSATVPATLQPTPQARPVGLPWVLSPTKATRQPSFWQQFIAMEILGHGSFGTVFQVKEITTSKLFTLKVLRRYNQLVAREVTMWQDFSTRCSTGNGVHRIELVEVPLDDDIRTKLSEYSKTQGVGALMMPEKDGFVLAILNRFIPGCDMHTYLYTMDPPSASMIYQWLLDVALQLQCAHASKILHRDIKMENIVISDKSSETGRSSAHVIDFGLSCQLTTGDNPFTCLGGNGAVVGSLSYMAPENLRNSPRVMKKPIDHHYQTAPSFASDVFALGATFYTFITGETIYRRAEEQGWSFDVVRTVLDEVQTSQWCGAPRTGDDTPQSKLYYERLQEIINRMLRMVPSERPTMADVVIELQQQRGSSSMASSTCMCRS